MMPSRLAVSIVWVGMVFDGVVRCRCRNGLDIQRNNKSYPSKLPGVRRKPRSLQVQVVSESFQPNGPAFPSIPHQFSPLEIRLSATLVWKGLTLLDRF